MYLLLPLKLGVESSPSGSQSPRCSSLGDNGGEKRGAGIAALLPASVLGTTNELLDVQGGPQPEDALHNEVKVIAFPEELRIKSLGNGEKQGAVRQLLSNLTVHLPASSPSKFPGGERQRQEGAEGDLWAGAQDRQNLEIRGDEREKVGLKEP